MTTHPYRIANNLNVGVSIHVDISPCDCPSVEAFIPSGATIVNQTVFACLILRYHQKIRKRYVDTLTERDAFKVAQTINLHTLKMSKRSHLEVFGVTQVFIEKKTFTVFR